MRPGTPTVSATGSRGDRVGGTLHRMDDHHPPAAVTVTGIEPAS
jgi:hypothetical protein